MKQILLIIFCLSLPLMGDDGKLLIHNASNIGNVEAVKRLLSSGVNVDQKNKAGGTPLHSASVKGRIKVVKLLIAKGANVNAQNNRGITPLNFAIGRKHPEVAELLRQNGGKTATELKAEKGKVSPSGNRGGNPKGNEEDERLINEFRSQNNVRYLQICLETVGLTTNKWCDKIKEEAQTPLVFLSPQLPQTKSLREKVKKASGKDKWIKISHYALNSTLLDSRTPSGGPLTPLLFECDLGWNGTGGLDDALKYMDHYKLNRIAVSFGDDSNKLLNREELKKLNWGASKRQEAKMRKEKFEKTLALAEKGDAQAQTSLGFMYDKGQGVEQDFKEAVKWYQKAADQGDADAQFHLGSHYVDNHVPKDYVTAYAWANMAAENRSPNGKIIKGILAKKMTPAQIAKAEKLVKEMVKKNPKLLNK